MGKILAPKDPAFLDQLKSMGMNDKSISEMTFTPGDHQFLVKLMTTRDEAVKFELKEVVIEVFESVNDATCKEVSRLLAEQTKQVAEHSVAMMKAMESIANDIKGIKDDIGEIKERLADLEEKVETDAERIGKLEYWARVVKLEELASSEMSLNDRFLRIEAYKPKFEYLMRYVSWWSMFWRTVIAAVIAGLLTGFIIIEIVRYLHSNGFLI